MIIWGSRGITSTTGNGTFFCPECKESRSYSRNQVRKFFTLYFIPIFPMADLGDYVECSSCHSNYKPAVLDYKPPPPPPSQDELLARYRRSLTELLVRARMLQNASTSSIEQIRDDITKASGSEPGKDIVETAWAKGPPSVEELRKLAGDMAPMLSDSGKEQTVAAVYRVIGELSSGGNLVIEQVGAGLGLSGAHIVGVLAMLRQSQPKV